MESGCVWRHGRPLACERERQPGVNAEEHHQQCLHRVHDEHEEERVVGSHAIEQEHGLHGEVPGPCSVGCGHHHGYRSHDEGHQGAAHSQVGGGVEAEEREVVVEEIAQPDGRREADEERHVLHVAHRQHALPQSEEYSFHLIIYSHAAQQVPQQYDYRHAADGRHHPSCGGEAGQHLVDACARLLEEGVEDAELAEQRDARYHEDERRVDGPLCHHGAQGFGKRHAVPPFEHAAACKLADARYDQAYGIREKHGVDRHGGAGLLAHGLQRLPPSPATEGLRHDAEWERQQHPCPAHLVEQHVLHAMEIEVAIHPIENGTAEYQRQRHFENVAEGLFHLFLSRSCHRAQWAFARAAPNAICVML